jgi:hypothetical protein
MLIVEKGENKKPIAYISIIDAFLKTCIDTDQKYGIDNYVDRPDLTINDFVFPVKAPLKGKDDFGPRLPYWVGMILCYTGDLVAKISGKNLPVSSIRVKKLF